MEMKIEFEDIISFIEKAIKNNLNIKTTVRNWGETSEVNITIYKDDDVYSGIYIQHFSDKNHISLSVTRNYLDWVDVEVSEIDIAKFKLEVLKAREYSKNKVIDYFNNFFKEESKPADINDLDNDDE